MYCFFVVGLGMWSVIIFLLVIVLRFECFILVLLGNGSEVGVEIVFLLMSKWFFVYV